MWPAAANMEKSTHVASDRALHRGPPHSGLAGSADLGSTLLQGCSAAPEALKLSRDACALLVGIRLRLRVRGVLVMELSLLLIEAISHRINLAGQAVSLRFVASPAVLTHGSRTSGGGGTL
mmetsp:Transcript_30580/g.81122  ORF Transcript_30580/g.81122 Transcript_30580/m.81122 type:complete len:121 (-) Transcript_30580:952-1314(-)